jgi:hypothetical protein
VRSLIGSLALAASLCAAPAVGQNAPPWSAKVRVRNSGENAVTGLVSSWLAEELRRWEGVQVVDSAPEWLIDIIVYEMRDQTGTVTGYALSEVVSARYDPSQVVKALRERKTEDRCRELLGDATALIEGEVWTFAEHALRTGSLDDLRRQIERLVANFDERQLEPSRKLWEKTHSEGPS